MLAVGNRELWTGVILVPFDRAWYNRATAQLDALAIAWGLDHQVLQGQVGSGRLLHAGDEEIEQASSDYYRPEREFMASHKGIVRLVRRLEGIYCT